MSTKRLKQNHNFWLLWLAQVISGIGDVLYTAGIMVNVYQYTGSALQTAWVMVASTFPAFVVGPFAGAIVDRYDRKKVLMVMDFIRVLLVLLLLLCVSANYFYLPGLYAIVACLSVASAFYRPAKMAIIPSIVAAPNLGQANSILIGTSQAIMAVGYGVGGLLTLWLGFEAFVLINAFTFLVSAFMIYFVQTPYFKPSPSPKGESLWTSAVHGYHDLRNHSLAYPLVVMEILEFFPHGIWTSAILLSFVEKALLGNADDWGYVAGAYFGSMMLGAVVATFAHKIIGKHTGMIIVWNAFFTSFITLVFALSPNVFAAIVVSLIFGFPNSIRDVAQDTLLQSTVTQNLLGRVYAFRNMFTNIFFMAGGLVFAWFADFTNVRYIYIAGGILYFLTGVYALGNKALRESKIEGNVIV